MLTQFFNHRNQDPLVFTEGTWAALHLNVYGRMIPVCVGGGAADGFNVTGTIFLSPKGHRHQIRYRLYTSQD